MFLLDFVLLRQSVGMDINYSTASDKELSFPDNSFDVITACQCFWYLHHEALARKFFKMLKPGGSFLVMFMEWLPFMIFNPAAMGLKSLVCLILAGVSACVGQFGITQAYMLAPAKEISVYDYTQVIFAAVFGFLIFNQVSDFLSGVGYFLICGAGITMFFYNKIRA